MPNPTEVAIIKRDGSTSLYTSYGNAKDNAVGGDLIQIRADLNEQIVLLDGVDIWIMPGVVVSNSSGDTITDIDTEETQGVHCKIYGEGIIKNTGGYSCVFIDHSDTELSIECDYIEGASSGTSTFRAIYIFRGSKFHLTCNKVLSKSIAIQLGSSSTNFIQNVNLNILRVETGDPNSTILATSVLVYANGFINIDEILCKNRGHALRHSGGTIIARIRKVTAIRADTGTTVSTVSVGQGDGTEKLILYFDEIQALGSGTTSSYDAIIIGAATGIFIGRRVFAEDSPAIEIRFANSKGYIKCDEIISHGSNALGLNDFTNQITLDVNYIEGNSGGEIGAIYSLAPANFLLKNAKVVNKNTNAQSRGISLFAFGGSLPTVELKDVKIVTADTGGTPPYNEIIYVNNQSNINIKNYNLFANREKESYVTLKIGDNSNHNFVVSNLLS